MGLAVRPMTVPIDLRLGSPAAAASPQVRAALAAGDWPVGYPPAAGLPVFTDAVCQWSSRVLGRDITADRVVPVAGAKEAVGTLPWLLGCGPRDVVAIPHLAYPTYAEGAAAVGAPVVRYRDPAHLAQLCVEHPIAVIWVASPANPTCRILPPADLHAIAALGHTPSRPLIAFDETYLEIADGEHSVLGCAPSGFALTQATPEDPEYGPIRTLGLYSVSKRNGLAALRVGYAITDPATASALVTRRRALGLLTSAPAMVAAAAALADDTTPALMRAHHRAQRAIALPAFEGAGFADAGGVGMFLWLACPDGDAAQQRLADLGVLVTAGRAFGPDGAGFIRVSLSGPADALAEAAARLHSASGTLPPSHQP